MKSKVNPIYLQASFHLALVGTPGPRDGFAQGNAHTLPRRGPGLHSPEGLTHDFSWESAGPAVSVCTWPPTRRNTFCHFLAHF